MQVRNRFLFMWRRLRSLGRRTREVPPGRLGLLLYTFLLLLAARVALLLVPSQRVLQWKQRPLTQPQQGPAAEACTTARWAVLVVARYAPVRFVCFPQCLAASELLRRRGIASRLHYGAARQEDKLITHTWLEVEGEIVIGGEVAGDFSTLAVYG